MNSPESINPDELKRQLAGFTGSVDYHRLTASIKPEIFWTDGCAFLAEQARCYWFLDAVASHQVTPRVRHETFQIWTLDVKQHQGAEPGQPMAMLTCRTDAEPEGTLLVEQSIEYTDFPLDSIKLYVVHGSIGGVQENLIGMLPGEY